MSFSLLVASAGRWNSTNGCRIFQMIRALVMRFVWYDLSISSAMLTKSCHHACLRI